MKGKGVFRPRYVKIGDERSPMRRLLEDGQCNPPGFVVVSYPEQWATLAKAQRLGYLDDAQMLTDTGRAFLSSAAK